MRILRCFFAVGLLGIMTSCNLPSTTHPTATEDFLSTAVRGTLTALPTRAVISTQIIALPTPNETTTTAPTPKPTLTGEISPTPSGDPRSWLGNPTRMDTLDSPQGFGLAGGYEDPAAKIIVSDGVMTMTSFSVVGWRTWRVRPPDLTNAYIDGVFRTVACSGSDQYGLVFKAPDYDTGFGYYFGVTCDGKFILNRWDSSGNPVLIPQTPENSILQGPGQTNRLGVMISGEKITLYINGRQVKDIQDNALPNGYYGVFLGGYSGNLTIQLDEIAYWVQP